ncbi:MAG: tol-pal system protein YbgF [Algicola sp.]|nr:tol-pal system protein YbgF [Algicola sp.]
MKSIKQVVYLGLLMAGTGAIAASSAAPVSDLSSSPPTDRLATVERLIRQSSQRQLQSQQQMDALLEEVNLLRGETELHSHKLEQLVERQRELYQELEDRFSKYAASLSEQGSIATSITSPLSVAPKEAVIAYSDDVDENEAYDNAMNKVLKERRYDEAIPEFKRFIKTFPDSEYAPNAYYWLGQLLFNKGNYRQSKTYFERVVNFYPDSNKRSDAVFKLGSIALKTNNTVDAKNLFERVISEYPGTTSAKLATSRLQSMAKSE